MGSHDSDKEDCMLIEKNDAVLEASDDSYDSTTPNSNQAVICQKCGVRGYANLLVYCDVCHVAAEHTYCLDTLSSKIDKKVDEWSCVECAPPATLSRLTLAPTLGDEQMQTEQPQDNNSGCEASENPLDYGLPVMDPVWRGIFEISGDEYGPIAAHISSKACLKVFEAAKALPSFLRMELPSRIDVWPKKFKLSAPTTDDIALYFFSDKQREEKEFAELVADMIDMDLALKFVFDESELVIFPSDQLPKSYWDFHGAHYLWGIFRRKTSSNMFL